MRRGWRFALASSTLACAAACGLSLTGTADLAAEDAGAPNRPRVDGTTPPGSPPPSVDADGTPDGSSGGGADASRDGVGTDAGAPDVADARLPPPDTGTDAGTPISCPGGGVVTDCAKCANNPLLCAMCKTGGIELVCVPKGSSCYDSYRTSGYDWCTCSSGNPSSCVLPEQECNSFGGGVCVTCGERQTQGFPCKGGGSCDEAMAKCK